MESKEEPEAEREATTEEFADDTKVLFPMENISLLDTGGNTPVTTSTPFQLCHSGLEKETPESGLVSQLDMVHDDTWNVTGNISTLEIGDAPSSLDHLNTFLESREVSPIRYTLRTSWNKTSARTKRQHVRKARQAVSAVLSEVAPEDPGQLRHALSKSHVIQLWFSEDTKSGTGSTDDTLLDALASYYKNADHWDTRRQILSIMADKASFAKIQEWIPGLTKYRYMMARQLILLHGRGTPVPSQSPRTRMVVPQEKRAHFLDLESVAERLGEMDMGMSWAKEKKEHRKKCKRNLKSDYKVHVSESSDVPDHCRVYALNDPTDRDYQEKSRDGNWIGSLLQRAMMAARDSEGNRLFTSAEFLTLQQVASFFSRLAAKRCLPDVTSGSDKEADDAETESALQELSNAVMREVSLEHLIVYNCYNICDLISSSKLSSFSIQIVREFCNFFELDTSHVKVRRKKPFWLLLVRTVPVRSNTVTELD